MAHFPADLFATEGMISPSTLRETETDILSLRRRPVQVPQVPTAPAQTPSQSHSVQADARSNPHRRPTGFWTLGVPVGHRDALAAGLQPDQHSCTTHQHHYPSHQARGPFSSWASSALEHRICYFSPPPCPRLRQLAQLGEAMPPHLAAPAFPTRRHHRTDL